ncbi:uncharacterized protein PHACADRAFT_246895 [Phanerochaete carnosa HHB-10118-sp]|uniref:non-specific serine/threonine protein kinase n=1 Tax=Phanerochaete carnosa (strain HHB-10118-sp) TaxID=650164 RepID=K5WA04_PHACS|nr:uncharacterized protein PHACADRAFT_246895 [Phanerochaete carnosa HHB-10118-sp]EKM60773.1 hypothetical protein PHACADRAFT_246895 [Phanerochaete carnosa HHB-10118-sp]
MAANPSHIGRNHIVSFLDSFTHAPSIQQCGSISSASAMNPDVHICIVFEPLGENLLALIERHKQTGVPTPLVKIIAKQVLLGLQYLHDECELVHTDIKPENIMISIPNVEGHIQTQLCTSPPPTSRKVGVPPKPAPRSGIQIPKRTNTLSVNTKQARQVQIFDSQPLVSPSASSSWSSRGLLQSLTKLKEASSASRSVNGSSVSLPVAGKSKAVDVEADAHAKRGSGESDMSDISSGPSSMAVSCGVNASVDTPPSSVGSLAGTLEKMALSSMDGKGKVVATKVEKEIQEATCTCIFDWNAAEAEGSMPKSRLSAPSGPSLLSRTAPPDLHRHKPHCSTHSKSPTDPSAPLPDADSLTRSLSSSSSPSTVSPSISSTSSPTPSANASALPVHVKIADLGNATPIRKHYTEDIQTRQYRSPEAITGRSDWGDTADIWSIACVVFELLTAEYLFDPQSQGELFGKDDDHCAQIIELLGTWPESVLWGGRYSREIFDSNGHLRYIRNLKPWPLRRVMVEKYGWLEKDAGVVCEFLLPMLDIDHHSRAHARDMVNHPWLEVNLEDLHRAKDW